MTLGSILLGLALLILVGLFVARPFLQRDAPSTRPQTGRQQLLAQKEAILAQIMTLEFDFETGKLPVELYQPERTELIAKAAVLLERLDNQPDDKRVELEIEAAVAQLRGQRVVTPVPSVNGHGRYCPQCGTPTDPDDKFCAACGHNLNNRLEKETDEALEKSVHY
jgi:hypothetical protein